MTLTADYLQRIKVASSSHNEMPVKEEITLSKALQDTSFNIWEGVYETFQDAKAEALGLGFGGDIYLARALATANECLDSLKTKKPIPQFHKQRSNLLPPIVALVMKERVSILDFGGSLGIGYMTLLESLPDAASKVQYAILETPEVCKLGEQLHGKGGGGGITYFSSIPLSTTFDIIHAASSLQYIENWKEWASAITTLNPKYIFLSDVFAGEINPYVTLQNYYGSRVPHWFLSLSELVYNFDMYGYQLIMKSSVSSRRLNQFDTLPMDNFPEPLRLSESLHLLFSCKKLGL